MEGLPRGRTRNRSGVETGHHKGAGPDALAYFRIDDIGGKPALVLRSSMKRDILAKGRKAYTYGLIFILGGGLALILAAGGLLQVLVLKPVSELTENILDAGKGPAALKSSLTSRKDELGTLSREFEAMMKNLVERENSLWLKERRLRQIIDLVPHFIFAKDETGKYILANKALSDAYGIPVTELVGRHDTDFVKSGEELQRLRANDEEVLRSGEQRSSRTRSHEAGETRILHTTSILSLFRHDIPSGAGNLRDQTRYEEKRGTLLLRGRPSTSRSATS